VLSKAVLSSVNLFNYSKQASNLFPDSGAFSSVGLAKQAVFFSLKKVLKS